MKNFFAFFLIIFLFFVSFGVRQAFANTSLACPDFTKTELTADELVGKINQCIEARKVGNSATITDFHCPSGNFSLEDGQGLTEDRIAYHITVNLYMNEVDEEMKKYMQAFQKERSKNAVAWTESYGSCIEGRPQGSAKSLVHFYDNICSFTFVNDFLNSNSLGKKYAISTQAFPQSVCRDLANKKKTMWLTMGSFMTQQGIAKSYANDRNYFVEGVQGQYRAIIEKFHTYQKIIFRASSKITHYIREAVK